MKRVKMVLLIGLIMIGAVYAGTRPEELTREEKNKILVEMAIGAMNQGDWELMAGLYSPGYVQHQPGNSKELTWEQFELSCRTVKQKIPTLRIEILDIVAEGNKVAVRIKHVITYKKYAFGGDKELQRIEYTEMDLFRIANDRIVEEWCECDTNDIERKSGPLKHIKSWY